MIIKIPLKPNYKLYIKTMIFHGELDDNDLANAIFHHSNVMPNRKKSSQVIKFSDKDKKKINSFDEISKIMLKILKENDCSVDNKGYVIECQQRNGGFGKNNKSPFIWHSDGEKQVTIILYIRKDRTIKGGNLMIDAGFSNGFNPFRKTAEKEIETKEGQCLIFDSEMRHKPTEFTGFGCRDIIVGFFKKT